MKSAMIEIRCGGAYAAMVIEDVSDGFMDVKAYTSDQETAAVVTLSQKGLANLKRLVDGLVEKAAMGTDAATGRAIDQALAQYKRLRGLS